MDSSSDTSEPGPTEWHPIRQLLGHPGYEFTLLTLHQPIRDASLYEDLWDSAKTKIAADGGANQIRELSKQHRRAEGNDSNSNSNRLESSHEPFKDLDVIIGDLDSLTSDSRAYFTPHTRIIREAEQDSTDFAKAVHLARRESPGRDIVCMGGLGGRVDQGLSQLHHLYLFQTSSTYADGRMYLVSGDSLSFVLKGGQKHLIRVREPGIRDARRRRLSGDPFAKYVGIVPVGGPAVISTKGLEWDVRDWPTAFGARMSTSNHVLPDTEVVEVQTDEDVLFTIALKQPSDS